MSDARLIWGEGEEGWHFRPNVQRAACVLESPAFNSNPTDPINPNPIWALGQKFPLEREATVCR